ncbi:MAG: DUF2157 domain-containing protein [Thermodesulfobacteriota bacterium]
MQRLSKTDAQKRADRIAAFQQELTALEKEQVFRLDAAQKASVAAYHRGLLETFAAGFDIDTSRREKQLSLGMRIASFLGALALAASVFFLFYQFWGRFSTPVQVVILTAAPLAVLALTALASAREPSGYFAKIFGMVCVACFVLNLVMLGRIFNITPSENAFLVWALFSFLLAYAIDARLLLAAAIISLACFLSARAGTWWGCYWIYFGSRPENFFPAAILLFVVPFLITHRTFSGFDVIYRVFAMLLLFLPVLVLANWGAASYLDIDPELVEYLYQAAGFGVSALAIWAGLRKNWPDVVNTGTVFFVIFLYTKFFDWWWEWLPKYIFFLIVALTAILALLVFKRLRGIGVRTEEVAS